MGLTFAETAQFSFLFWLCGVVLTRFIRGPYALYLRVPADLILSAGILALPMPADQWRLIAIATYLLILVDSWIAIERPTGHA